MTPIAVTIILNGAVLASAPTAQLVFGHVMAPLSPVITHLTHRAVVDGDAITLTRGDRTCVLHVGTDAMTCGGVTEALPVAPFGHGGIPFVPVAEIARAFGGAAAYDAHARILALDLPPTTELQSPAPFNPAAPSVAPTAVFTPSPPPATPRPVDTGSPQPRRTAVPAIPSRVPN